jgi:hypothetical protein
MNITNALLFLTKSITVYEGTVAVIYAYICVNNAHNIYIHTILYAFSLVWNYEWKARSFESERRHDVGKSIILPLDLRKLRKNAISQD